MSYTCRTSYIIMDSYQDLMQQEMALRERMELARKRELGDTILSIARLMVLYSISLDDIEGAIRELKSPAPRRKRVPQYMDPVSGKTWCGSGRRPKWMHGQDIENFRIKTDASA